MEKKFQSLSVPRRVLLGPGPSNVPPEVLQAMALPVIGHLDPAFLAIMEEVQAMLRTVFATTNRFTIPISATGSAGMEAALVNAIERGDKALVCVNGVFGVRMCDIVERAGGELKKIEAEWGTPFQPDQVRDALKNFPAAIVAIVHAETSTGVLQPLEEISRIVHDHGALFVVDAVTSLGGTPVNVDDRKIDVCYSGTQKCLSCPPGLSPITFSDSAIEKLKSRTSKVQSWYLDMTMIEKYWGPERVYHHTAPISMIYALREALRLALDEGLESRFDRHRRLSAQLIDGLEKMGLEMLVDRKYRTPMLNAVKIPCGVDEAVLRKRLLERYGIEIGAGLGPLKGKIWRIGLMGHSCAEENISLILSALKSLL
ncbi:MAG: alanine--glyoxylate aminotransferase family protein [Deltaproteobacteria bacterium]|nr:alanine--glyoxylate aminotransferase family protein [Deltaproteobacteria bacterium]